MSSSRSGEPHEHTAGTEGGEIVWRDLTVPLLLLTAATALVTGLGAQEQGVIRVENAASTT
jgi:hypothetical protein